MRVIDAVPAPARPLEPIPPDPDHRESIAVTWCREIATAVAAALDTDARHLAYRLTARRNVPLPHTLHTAFTITGPTGTHTVRITAHWDDPWQAPGFALTVDDRPITFDTDSPARPAVVLAHAAWQAVADLDTAGVR